MSDRPRVDGSAPTRGIVHVTLKKVAADPIDFKYVFLYLGMNAHFLCRKYPNNTRAFFTKDAGIQPLGGGLELWRGYFQ
jgi:eukaryotic translation initiation factor 2C